MRLRFQHCRPNLKLQILSSLNIHLVFTVHWVQRYHRHLLGISSPNWQIPLEFLGMSIEASRILWIWLQWALRLQSDKCNMIVHSRGMRGQLPTLNLSLSENFLRKSMGRNGIFTLGFINLAGLSRAELHLSAFEMWKWNVFMQTDVGYCMTEKFTTFNHHCPVIWQVIFLWRNVRILSKSPCYSLILRLLSEIFGWLSDN